jgi:lambda family phage tail tape measure protein
MANTIDNFTLKVSVDGTAQVKTATQDIKNFDAAAQTSAKNLNNTANSIRNVGFQVQDFTVQVSNGTSAITALSQQLPQLLSNFGTIGVYLGIAAAAIPLVVAGFKLLGGDSRDLNERIKDLTDSTKAFVDAQKQNQPTLKGLGNEYGSLTAAAKEFFQIQQDLLKVKADFELTSAISKLKSEFAIFSPDVKKLEEELGKIGSGYVIGGLDGIATAFKRMNLGLNAEQAKYVADQLKNIDPKNAEATANTFNDILTYLKETGAEGDKFLKFWNETVQPIITLNQQILTLNQNVKASAEAASAFNAEMLKLQTSFIPKIGDAKRANDQITAIRLEGALKIAEFERQINEQSQKDQVDRSAEIAAFRAKTAAEIANAEKDIAKQQFETFRGVYLTADAKGRQVELEGQILDIQEKGRYNLQYETQLEIDRLRNLRDYESTMLNIQEMRRKNTITEAQAASLQREAELTQRRANENAEVNRQRRINDAKDAQTAAMLELQTRSIGIDNERELLRIRQDMRNAYPEDIDSAVKIAQLKAQQADYERRINEEVRLGKITQGDAADRIAQANSNLQQSISLERERNAEASRYRTLTFDEGIQETLQKMAKEVPTPFQAAERSVRAVFDGMTNALDSFVRTGKLNFKQLAMSIIADILRIQLQANMSPLFNSSGTGGFLSSLLKFFPRGGNAGNISYAESPLGFSIPAFAAGGIVNKPTIGLIGEAGPEAVVPLGQMRPAVVNYNISAVDAASFRALVARDPQFIYNITEQGRRSQPSRRLA